MKKLFKLLTMLVLALSLTTLSACTESKAEYYYYASGYGNEEHFQLQMSDSMNGHSFYRVYTFLKDMFTENGWTIDDSAKDYFVFYAHRPAEYALTASKEPQRQYGLFFYTYDTEMVNPFVHLLKEYDAMIDSFLEEFPGLAMYFTDATLEFTILTDTPFYRTDSTERYTDMYGRYYHMWSTTYNEASKGTSKTITIRQYVVNIDGWYALAVLLAAAFLGIVLLVDKNKRKKEAVRDRLLSRSASNSGE